MKKLRNSIVNTTGHKENQNHPLYRTWNSMIGRCYYASHKEYFRYGGLGIKVSNEWLDFNQFKQDMGQKPTVKHQLDRIDPTKNYCKENCRWVTPTENTLNSRPRNGRKYKGVYQHKGRSQYFVMITVNKKPLYCGSFNTEEEAALCYNKYMLIYYGDTVRFNEVTNTGVENEKK